MLPLRKKSRPNSPDHFSILEAGLLYGHSSSICSSTGDKHMIWRLSSRTWRNFYKLQLYLIISASHYYMVKLFPGQYCIQRRKEFSGNVAVGTYFHGNMPSRNLSKSSLSSSLSWLTAEDEALLPEKKRENNNISGCRLRLTANWMALGCLWFPPLGWDLQNQVITHNNAH